MAYSDVQMIIASQLAYIDFNNAAVRSGDYTVQELLEMTLESTTDSEEVATIQNILRRMDEDPTADACRNWIIRDIRSDQQDSGMYACMIDTADGNALIAFRGSESDTTENLIKDWGQSDFGLLNSVLTPQQEAAQEYTQYIYERYGNQYENFGVTGHSLGGNLAEHATITASDEMQEKISQCVNLDGPGFSDVYLMEHKSDIADAQDRITHYQWSLVGALLMPVPGSTVKVIDAETPDDQGDWFMNYLWRHDTNNITNLDENGNFQAGERDELATGAWVLSKFLDLSVFYWSGAAFLSITVMPIVDQIKSWWEQWQTARRAAKNVSYEISVYTAANQMDTLGAQKSELLKIAEEMESIEKNLAFSSASTSYYKLRLWSLANSLDNRAKKLSNLSEKGLICIQNYEASENSVAQLYQ